MTAMIATRAHTPNADAFSSAAAEAYRVLRSSVKFAEGDTPLRTVLVVDIDRAEPSGVAHELAAAFARAGDRCALVDLAAAADDAPGFANLLTQHTATAHVGQPTDIPNLTRIGPGADFLPDQLASTQVTDTFHALHSDYAYVVVACAALPSHGDALALAPRVDGVILVVTSGKTRRPRAVEARDQLERVGARLLGVVLLGWPGQARRLPRSRAPMA
jgi:non-specific protein-tyrosine kinase